MTGPLDSSVTLEEVLSAATAKRVPIAPELAGYLVLEVADKGGALRTRVDPRTVFLSDEGSLAIVDRKSAPPLDKEPESSLRELLAILLEHSGSTTPALSTVAKKKPGAGVSALVEELEAALIPVNRAAGRRALARLAREVKRVTLGIGRNASTPPPPRVSSTPPPPKVSSAPPPPRASSPPPEPTPPPPRTELGLGPSEDRMAELISSLGTSSDSTAAARELKRIAGLEPTPTPLGSAASEPPPAEEPPLKRRERSTASAPPPAPTITPKKRSNATWILALFAVLLFVFGGYYVSTRVPRLMRDRGMAASTPSAPFVAGEPRVECRAALDVTDIPVNAEVLLRLGQAPLDVPRLPMETRLEFVLTAEGYLPKRAVIERDARWDRTNKDAPRFTLPVTLEPQGKSKGAELWPSGEPGVAIGGRGVPGTVHIEPSVKGAEAWLLVAIGPEAHLSEIPCDRDVELLLAGPTTFRKRVAVPASRFAKEPGDTLLRARVSAKEGKP